MQVRRYEKLTSNRICKRDDLRGGWWRFDAPLVTTAVTGIKRPSVSHGRRRSRQKSIADRRPPTAAGSINTPERHNIIIRRPRAVAGRRRSAGRPAGACDGPTRAPGHKYNICIMRILLYGAIKPYYRLLLLFGYYKTGGLNRRYSHGTRENRIVAPAVKRTVYIYTI